LVHDNTGQRIACPTWEWAELDGKRLVWVDSGKLFGANLRKNGPAEAAELFDFGHMTFEELKAPY
jgi:hypothetical protein